MNAILRGSLGLAAAWSACSQAQVAGDPVRGDPVVVTATRVERRLADVPATIDVIDGERLRDGQAQVNLSETLPSIPGVVVNNRQNYAQDLQVSIRGFGARSTFGVRGLRILVDGIPATLPDGQSQVSHVDLASVDRIEVLRGPFSALYGNSSGGVIDVTTANGRGEPASRLTAIAGSDALRRGAATLSGATEGASWLVSAGRFRTNGYREHSVAERTNANAKLRFAPGPTTTLTFVANALDMPDTQDPLGLTRAQFEANPRGVDPVALQFDTRKSVDQAQAGMTLDHAGGGQAIRLAAYAGRRGTRQYQSIPAAPQANPLHPGGVIELERGYNGVDARWSWEGGPFSLVIGANLDRLDEDRRGFQNFVGVQVGILGALRRDEKNRVAERGTYAQLEWQLASSLRFLAGARASRVEFRSRDRYTTGANPDDSGRVAFSATTPVAGLSWRAADGLSLHAAAGRGFETPTTNELAYRPGGATGLNFELRPAKSDNWELGARWRAGAWRVSGAAFRIDTQGEIVVDTNSGGRSTFRNAAETRREGFELQVARAWGRLDAVASASSLRATFVDGRRIPGIPRRTAHAEVRWLATPALELAAEARHASALAVNDANTDSAPAYSVANLRAGYRWRAAGLALRTFVRVDNAFDRRYAGSVIVNEGNARYFEPAPGRAWLAGITLDSPILRGPFRGARGGV